MKKGLLEVKWLYTYQGADAERCSNCRWGKEPLFYLKGQDPYDEGLCAECFMEKYSIPKTERTKLLVREEEEKE